MLLGSGESSGLLLLPAKGDFIGAGVLNWDYQRSLEQVVKINRSGKGAKEDAARLTSVMWPLQVVQKHHDSWQTTWGKVLFSEKTSFFLSLDKENPSAPKGDKSSHSVQS